MTPFGLYLESLRRSRKLQQTQLADILGVHSGYISAIERGKKGPPSNELIEILIKNLELDTQESEELRLQAEKSKRTIRLPDSAAPEEYELIHELKENLGSLSTEQITIIRNTLRLGNKHTDAHRIKIRSGE